MSNELQKEWDELVDDAKAGCTALMQHYDAAIIAADELIKEQQAEIEHYNNQLDRACGDGNTPADFDKLRDANLALAMESHQQQAHIERLREALSNLEQAAKYTADAHGVDVYADLCETAGEACRVLNETPAQSLEALKREWQAEALERCVNLYAMKVLDGQDMDSSGVLDYALKIREGHNND